MDRIGTYNCSTLLFQQCLAFLCFCRFRAVVFYSRGRADCTVPSDPHNSRFDRPRKHEILGRRRLVAKPLDDVMTCGD